mmetsp:Transcript_51308/g.111350  ORF Transcript_51308/g.111350 Transcript_51308/m.111350 type:complete len:109 (+) Transcript_51308:161-487(+)
MDPQRRPHLATTTTTAACTVLRHIRRAPLEVQDLLGVLPRPRPCQALARGDLARAIDSPTEVTYHLGLLQPLVEVVVDMHQLRLQELALLIIIIIILLPPPHRKLFWI